MNYEFNLEDYWETRDVIEEREDVENGFRQIKIAEGEDSELYAYGFRVYIPELNMSVREGAEYSKDDEIGEYPTDTIIVYVGNEKDPKKYVDAYCNTSFTEVVALFARELGKNTNPKCYIDDEEFDIWTDDD